MDRSTHHHHNHRRSGWENSAPEDDDSFHDPEPGARSHRRDRYDRERPSKRRHLDESSRDSWRKNDGWEHDKFDGNERHSKCREGESRHQHHPEHDPEKKRRSREKEKDEKSSSRGSRHERSRSSSDELGDYSPLARAGDNLNFKSSKQEELVKLEEFTQHQQQLPVAPTGTVVVKGLSQKTVEDDLYRALEGWGPLKHVRVIKEKLSGASRGFAFIDFPSPEAAEKLMLAIGNDGVIVNGRRLFFEYSRPAGVYSDHRFSGLATKPPPGIPTDWVCAICGYLNFARRIVCLQCNEARGEEVADFSGVRGSDPAAPSHVLAVRGLEENIDEEILHYEFSKYAPIKDLRLIRDKFTHVSRGYAFIHFHNVEDATRALESSNGIAIDKFGQILRVAFAKSPYGMHGGPPAVGRASTAMEAAATAQQYDAGGWQPKEYEAQVQPEQVQAQAQQAPAQAQDQAQQAQPSGFVWDETSGYYYDAASKFYYDATSNLYYDGSNAVWYTFNPDLQQYQPYIQPPPPLATEETLRPPGSEPDEPKEKPKKPRAANAVISAPAVHNDSQEKTTRKATPETPKEVRLALKNPASANKKKMTNAFNLWKQRQNEDCSQEASDPAEQESSRPRQKSSNSGQAEPVSTSSSRSDTPATATQNSRSKRRFTEGAPSQTVYRDRAAERRSLYGLSVPGSEEMEKELQLSIGGGAGGAREMPYPPGVGGRSSSSGSQARHHHDRQQGVESFEGASSEKALDETNIGNRMLRSMGWQEGSGLGKEGTGIVEPVQAKAGNERAGLGSRKKVDGRFEARPGDSYRAIIQKKSFARFHDML